MSKKNHQYLYRSPFNFLDPYTKEDAQIFFGRDEEIDDVYLLFEKTNLVVIYGPSGSGKSSLAQCGLVNRFFDWKPIEIRRNLNIIDSFFDAIELETNSNGEIIKGLFKKEDCKNLRVIFDKLIQSQKTDNYNSIDNQNLIDLRELFESLYINLTVIPFFIFDQFEELFIENNDSAEIENFSLLLSLITKNISYSNVVICIQTEFFSNLVRLEGYNPNILNYKCEIDDPNEDNIRKIIRGTFEKFNINQVHDGTNNPISNDEKELRIDEIISRIEKVGLHLPFVQIYLDKLYVLDFSITYPKHVELLRNSENIDSQRFSLEFKKEEIQRYGEIEEILKDYINEVSAHVISAENLLHKTKENSEYAVIKFLKYFITKKDTRKSIKVQRKPRKKDTESTYFVLVQPYQQEVIKKVWNDAIDNADETIGDIIDELLKARILKHRNEQLEFSHNFLVKVVKDVKVPEDVKDIYNREFNAAFEAYKFEEESRNELLVKTKIKKLEPYISQILDSDKDQKNQKEKFWSRSIKWANIKKWSQIGITMAIAITAAGSVGIYAGEKNAKKNARLEVENELKQAKIDKARVKVKEKLIKAFEVGETDKTKSYKLFAEAARNIKEDTLVNEKEFKYELDVYNNLIQNYNFEPFYTKKIPFLIRGKRPIISTTKHRVLKDESIALFALTSEGLYSKSATINKNVDLDGQWTKISASNAAISSFEPYFDRNENLRVLFSNEDGLFGIDYNSNKVDTLSLGEDYKNLENLDQVNNFYFAALNKEKQIVAIDLLSNEIDVFKMPTAFELLKMQSFGKTSATISYIGVKDDSVNIYRHKWSSRKSKPELMIKVPLPFDNKVLRSFKVDNDGNQFLFEDDRQVYAINIDQNKSDSVRIVTKINSYHKQNIISFDSQEDYYLLGSNDKTASLFYDPDPNREGDEKLLKQLRGHTDALKNVSFIGNKKDFVLTTSEDATFVIWDITETAEALVNRNSERKSIKIKFIDDQLYVAHDDGNRGDLLILNKERLNLKKTIKPSANNASIFNLNGSYCAFDFDDSTNRIVAALRYNKRIISFNLNGTDVKEIIGWDDPITYERSTIDTIVLDLAIQKEKIALATVNGIYYFSDYHKLDKFNETAIDNKTYKLKNSKNKTIESLINTVEFHPSKPWLIASSKDGNIYHCDLENKSCKILEDGHEERVEVARFSPDGRFIFSGSWDNKVIIWQLDEDLKSYTNKFEIPSHSSDIEDIAVTQMGNSLIIASGSSDKTVELHKMPVDIDKGEDFGEVIQRLPSIITHDNGIRSITFGENPSIIYTADALGRIKKWNWQTFDKIIETRTAN